VDSVEWTVEADDGVRLHVERWAAGAPDAPLVLGLHGITATRRGFLPLLGELGGEVDFVACDARGRGLSDKPSDPASYGHRRHAEDAAAVLRDLGRRADVVVGQSMGAWDGLQLAAHHPDLVGALVLGDGGFFCDIPDDVTPSEHIEAIMGAGWADRLAAEYPSRDGLFAVLRQLPPYAAFWSPVIEDMLDAGLEELPDGRVRNRCTVVAAHTDSLDYFVPADRPYVRADLSRVDAPVHLIRAPRGFDLSPETAAPLISEEAVAGFRRELPQLVVDTIPDTNHFTVNFGREGVLALADAVRKALR
jgi:lipase